MKRDDEKMTLTNVLDFYKHVSYRLDTSASE